MASFIIGVAGGSGSGKSTVTEHIIHAIGDARVAVIMQDSYYKDLSHLPLVARQKVNLDHPDAFDWELLNKHIIDLYNGISIEMPTYDFTQYVRLGSTITVNPAQVVILEGIFSLLDDEISKKMALKLFVDTASDIRFIRRLKRDVADRGRTAESVIKQYLEYVRPMHKKFIEPTKRFSHIIIPHGANKAALEMIVARIRAAINNEELVGSNYIHLNENLFFDEE